MARTDGQRRVVLDASRGARAAGIAAGQSVALAQASVPGLAVIEADPRADAAALTRLAVWALRYTPMAAPDGEDGLVLETTGADHLMGGEAALLSDALLRLRKAGLSVRGALSSSPSLSRGLARFGAGTDGAGRVVPPGDERAAAAGLPVAALGLDPAAARALRRLGMDRVGALLDAPRASLARRLGTEAPAALDRLLGTVPEPFAPVCAPEMTAARLVLAEPIAHTGGVVASLDHLTEDLCAQLAARGQGLRIADLVTTRVDGSAQAVRVRAAAPTRAPDHLRRLFAQHIDTIDPGFGIERLALVAPRTERLDARQRDTGDERSPPIERLVDRIGARLGPGRVFRLVPTEADMPERACRRAAPVPPVAPAAAGAAMLAWDRASRPALLIEPPEPARVVALLPDHPPARFSWRGGDHRVVRADGPECVFGEWWRADEEVALTRDYYRVETQEGGRFWLFRARDEAAGTASWFVHGAFA